ncbi:DUF2637 domain-containing protein [Nocardia sp. NPDC052001]|uniref:DUF2637 domain-containing protein n=1 Tax=Nocardia sp. NPDC052001 TaxID=3154853 RepID=UPI003430EA4E
MTTVDHPLGVSCERENSAPASPASIEETQQETIAPHQETLTNFSGDEEETMEQNPPRRDSVEMAALLMVIAVLMVASGWSAIALHGLAQASGITSWLAWGAPVIVDGPMIQSAVALVVLKRRAAAGAHVEDGQRAFFWWMLAASELISLVGNGAHAAMSETRSISGWAAAAVAGAAPIAVMAVMHGLTILIEVFGQRHKAPASPDNTVRTGSVRPSEVPSPAVSSGDAAVSCPSPTRLQETTEETPSVSYPSPGDAQGTTEETVEETAASPIERDAEIWALHSSGKSLREIAETMDLSKSHVGRILARLKTEHATDTDDEGGEVVLQLVR